MDNLVQRYQALDNKRKVLERKGVELETTYNHHRQEYKRLLEELKTEFKVNSLKEGYELHEKLSKEITAELEKLEKALSEFEKVLSPEEDSSEPSITV